MFCFRDQTNLEAYSDQESWWWFYHKFMGIQLGFHGVNKNLWYLGDGCDNLSALWDEDCLVTNGMGSPFSMSCSNTCLKLDSVEKIELKPIQIWVETMYLLTTKKREKKRHEAIEMWVSPCLDRSIHLQNKNDSIPGSSLGPTLIFGWRPYATLLRLYIRVYGYLQFEAMWMIKQVQTMNIPNHIYTKMGDRITI